MQVCNTPFYFDQLNSLKWLEWSVCLLQTRAFSTWTISCDSLRTQSLRSSQPDLSHVSKRSHIPCYCLNIKPSKGLAKQVIGPEGGLLDGAGEQCSHKSVHAGTFQRTPSKSSPALCLPYTSQDETHAEGNVGFYGFISDVVLNMWFWTLVMCFCANQIKKDD